MKIKEIVFTAFIICCFIYSGNASSETIDLYTSANWSNLKQNVIIFNEKEETAWAGSFNLTKVGGGFSTSVFCVEIDQNISVPSGPYTFNVNDLDDVESRYQNAGWLMNEFSSLIDTPQSGALQLAIWEVIYDTTFNLGDGNFKIKTPASGFSDLLSQITIKYNATENAGHSFDMSRFATFTSLTVQDLIGIDPSPVPEPATMLLFGAGLAGIAGLRLRRK